MYEIYDNDSIVDIILNGWKIETTRASEKLRKLFQAYQEEALQQNQFGGTLTNLESVSIWDESLGKRIWMWVNTKCVDITIQQVQSALGKHQNTFKLVSIVKFLVKYNERLQALVPFEWVAISLEFLQVESQNIQDLSLLLSDFLAYCQCWILKYKHMGNNK